MEDRRNYPRLPVTRDVSIYVNGRDIEIKGVITDISEEGIGIDILVKDVPEEFSQKYTTIKFQFLDKYPFGKDKEYSIVQGNAIVVRLTFMGKKCHLGCVVRDKNFKSYARKRRFSDYFSNL